MIILYKKCKVFLINDKFTCLKQSRNIDINFCFSSNSKRKFIDNNTKV